MSDKDQDIKAMDYIQPYWSSLPLYDYNFDVLKEGSIVDSISLMGKEYFVIGRNKDSCDIPLENPTVSRRHVVIQHKDTGDILLYDLGSTHGTFLNKKQIPIREYVKINVGDMFRVGQSSRLFLLNGPEFLIAQPEGNEQIGSFRVSDKPKVDKEALFKLRVEKLKKIQELREQNKISFTHNVEGASWGMDAEDVKEDEENESSAGEDDLVGELDFEKLKQRPSLTDKQKGMIQKLEKMKRKMKSLENESSFLMKKQKTNVDATNVTQKYKMYQNDTKVDQLVDKIDILEDNLRRSLQNHDKQLKGEKYNAKKTEDDYYREMGSDEDEFYNRAKVTGFKKTDPKSAQAPVETYESLKSKLEVLIRRRQELTDGLQKKTFERKEETAEKAPTDEEDPLEAFMQSNDNSIQENEKSRIRKELSEVAKDIDQHQKWLSMVTPSHLIVNSRKPKVKSTEDLSNSQQNTEILNAEREKEDKGKLKQKKKEQPNASDSIAEAMKRFKKLEEENAFREKNREQEVKEPPIVGIPHFDTAEGEEEEAENEEGSYSMSNIPASLIESAGTAPMNYFQEIIQNRNQDNIDLSKYKLFVGELEASQREKDKMASSRELQPTKDHMPGLQEYKKVLQKRTSDQAELEESEQAKKRLKTYGVSKKPMPRNIQESQVEKTKDIDSVWIPPKEETSARLEDLKKKLGY